MRAALTASLLFAFAVVLVLPMEGAQDEKAKSAERFEKLREYGRAYYAHHEANFNKPGREAPRNWEDLVAAGLDPNVKKFFKDNEFAVVFGIALHDLKNNGTSEVMIAYSTKAVQYGPQQYGHVAVFMDGHVSAMTDEEFKASQKILEPYLKRAVLQLPSKPAR